jgi:hypothetical protein
MFKRRAFDGFNLAFLDVMACGLGAIILILMLVKFNAARDIPSDEMERLQQELAALKNSSVSVAAEIAQTDNNLAQETLFVQQSQQRIQQLARQQQAEQLAINDKKAVLAEIEKSIAAAAPKQVEDNITLQGRGEETYLLGLKVEGQYIGILMDASASMTDETLINIIRRKIASDTEKKAAPKWQRTKRVAKWLLARVPQASKVTMVSFNETATQMGPQSIVSAKSSLGMKQLSASIEQLIPQHGTNLQIALETIKKLSPNMTHLYVVTDGLPTLGKNSKSLEALASCTSLFGKSKTITGECRLRLFAYSVQQANLTGVQVNIILLPLEGDPHGPQAYWDWASSTGGLLISPADSWP